MTGIEALQSVQFVTVKGKRFALLDSDDWEAMIEWLETIEDTRTVQQALKELEAAGSNRDQAGWLRWEDVADQLA